MVNLRDVSEGGVGVLRTFASRCRNWDQVLVDHIAYKVFLYVNLPQLHFRISKETPDHSANGQRLLMGRNQETAKRAHVRCPCFEQLQQRHI